MQLHYYHDFRKWKGRAVQSSRRREMVQVPFRVMSSKALCLVSGTAVDTCTCISYSPAEKWNERIVQYRER